MWNKSFLKGFLSMRFFAFIAVMSCALTINAQQKCRRCEGEGTIPEQCAYCYGRGEKPCSTCGGRGVRNCGFCSGSGSLRCNYCRGRGTIKNNTEYCPNCYERGYRDGNVPCENCYGKGEVPCPSSDCYDGKVGCHQCNGTGIHKWRCPDCRGTGQAR